MVPPPLPNRYAPAKPDFALPLTLSQHHHTTMASQHHHSTMASSQHHHSITTASSQHHHSIITAPPHHHSTTTPPHHHHTTTAPPWHHHTALSQHHHRIRHVAFKMPSEVVTESWAFWALHRMESSYTRRTCRATINCSLADLHLPHNKAHEQTLTHASGIAAERCGQRGLVCSKLRPARADHGVQSRHMAPHLGPQQQPRHDHRLSAGGHLCPHLCGCKLPLH